MYVLCTKGIIVICTTFKTRSRLAAPLAVDSFRGYNLVDPIIIIALLNSFQTHYTTPIATRKTIKKKNESKILHKFVLWVDMFTNYIVYPSY